MYHTIYMHCICFIFIDQPSTLCVLGISRPPYLCSAFQKKYIHATSTILSYELCSFVFIDIASNICVLGINRPPYPCSAIQKKYICNIPTIILYHQIYIQLVCFILYELLKKNIRPTIFG